MASILCVTTDLVALMYSSIELVHRLQAAGHRVVYASYPEARQTLEDHGLEFLPLERDRYDEFHRDDAQRGAIRRLLTLRRRRQHAVDAARVDGFADAVRAVDPDLILIDGEMHEHIIAASATGKRMALLTIFVGAWRRAGLPPPHHLARPGVGWRGSRLGTSLLWLNLRLRKYRTAWAQKARHLGCDRLSILRELARRTGFDFRREVDFNQWLIPFTYKRLPALSTHALEFEFPHDPRPGVHYIGPLVLEKRAERRLAKDTRAELDAVFERRRAAAGRRSLIYAGFGSFFSTDTGFLRRMLDAVAEREEWDLVVSLGGQSAPEVLTEPPQNVHVFPWVPQTEVLQSADAIITHGGIGTIDECVWAGVPMLVYCGFETDMGGSTSRVVYHQLGIAGDRERDSPETIREHLDRLLREPVYAEAVERMRSVYVARVENRVAERIIESLLSP